MGLTLQATIPNVVGTPTLTPITTTSTIEQCGIPYPPGSYYFADYSYLRVGTGPVAAEVQVRGPLGLPTPFMAVQANLTTTDRCVAASARTDPQGVARLTFPAPDPVGWYSPTIQPPKTWVLSARAMLGPLEVARLGGHDRPLPRFAVW